MADEGVKGVMMVDSPPHQPQKKSYYSSAKAKRGQEWFSKVQAQHFSSLFSSHFLLLPHFFQQTVSGGLSPAGVGMIRPRTSEHANAASTYREWLA